jgi:hypothetical protein
MDDFDFAWREVWNVVQEAAAAMIRNAEDPIGASNGLDSPAALFWQGPIQIKAAQVMEGKAARGPAAAREMGTHSVIGVEVQKGNPERVEDPAPLSAREQIGQGLLPEPALVAQEQDGIDPWGGALQGRE